MPAVKSFIYQFNFPDREPKRISIELELPTLKLISPTALNYPDWAALNFNQCPNCTLDIAVHKYCPVATNISGVIDAFKDCLSIDEAEIVVFTEQRTYRKRALLSEGLSSMMGLIMPTSGCPILDKLRPMAYTHLPFASVKETTYRAVSMYLMAQYFLGKRGKDPDWELRNLIRIYEEINILNHSFVKRLKSISTKDANINALVNLDCFSLIIPSTIVDDLWDAIEPIFNSYLVTR